MTTGCTIGKGADIRRLEIPETDAAALWPIYDRYRDRFVSLRADCSVSPIKYHHRAGRAAGHGFLGNTDLR